MGGNFRTAEYKFAKVTFSGGVTPSGFGVFTTDQSVVGNLLDVRWISNFIGSIALQASGTNIEMFRRNAPSGTATWQLSEPRLLQQTSTGSIAGAFYEPYYICEPLNLRYDIGSNAAATISGQSITFAFRYQ